MYYEIHKLSVHFPDIPLDAVRDVSFRLKKKHIFALVGETGSGKTMIARAITGMLPKGAVAKGQVERNGQNLLQLSKKEMRQHRRGHVSIVLQNAAAALNPLLSLKRHLQLAAPYRLTNKDMLALLDRVSLKVDTGFLKKRPFELSGGMKQRFLLAMALVKSPELIILDEPTRGLDEELRANLGREISKIREYSDSAILLITHDLPFAQDLSQNMAVLHEGQIVESGMTEKLFAKPRHPYFRSLLSALPKNNFQLLAWSESANNVHTQLCEISTGHFVRCPLC